MAAHRSPFVVALLIALVAAPAFAGPPRPADPGPAPAATPAAAVGAPDAATTTVVAPAPAKPGHIVVVADADGLVAQVAGALHGLKIGANRFEVKAGAHTVVVQTKKGAKVGSYDVTVAAEGEATVKVATVGTLTLNVADGGALEVDGKKIKAKDGVASTSVSAGKHSVVVRRPGYFGTKGDLEVMAGTRVAIDPAMEKFKGGNTTLAWVGVLGGSALVLSAVLIEAFADADALGGDATRWALVGVGAAGFVGGTILMKDILKKENNPPVHPGTIKAKLSMASKGARVAFRF